MHLVISPYHLHYLLALELDEKLLRTFQQSIFNLHSRQHLLDHPIPLLIPFENKINFHSLNSNCFLRKQLLFTETYTSITQPLPLESTPSLMIEFPPPPRFHYPHSSLFIPSVVKSFFFTKKEDKFGLYKISLYFWKKKARWIFFQNLFLNATWSSRRKKTKTPKKKVTKRKKKTLGIEPTSKYFHQNPSCHRKTGWNSV